MSSAINAFGGRDQEKVVGGCVTTHLIMPMQAGEEPCAYLKRAFFEVLGSLEPASLELVELHFHPHFRQFADGEELDLQAFTNLLRLQKSRLVQAPRFVWKQLVSACSPNDSRIHITSIHTATARLKTGLMIRQQVMALVQVDTATGTIIQCDELTRMEDPRAVERRAPYACPAGAFEGGGAPQQPVTQRAAHGADGDDASARREPSPSAKRARSSPEPQLCENPMRLHGVPLRRTTPVDHLEPPTVCLLRTASLGQLANSFESFAALDGTAAPTSKQRGMAVDAKTGRSISYASTMLAYDESDCDSIFESSSCRASIDMV